MTAIGLESFVLFCAGNFLLGIYQAFANLHRFAAADSASPTFESKAISLVLAGGVVAAFLGPLNASRATDLLPGLTHAGPYAIIVALSLAGGGLHLLLRHTVGWTTLNLLVLPFIATTAAATLW